MTPERKAAIIRLLSSRDEHLPEPRHRTEAAAGFIHRDPENRETCWDCLANDRRMFGCETCGGSGWVKKPRVRDPYASNEVQLYGLDGSSHDAAYERDRQIEELRRQTRPASAIDELADANASPYGWERARKRMYDSFDYGALDLALEQLRVADDGASRALHAVYVYGWQPHPLTGPLQVACERGLVFLDENLPEKLRVPAAPPPPAHKVTGQLQPGGGAGSAAKAVRDGEMRQRANEGATPAEIAAEFRVSIRTVYDAVKSVAA